MSVRLHDEQAGFSLPELLIEMVLSILVLGGTLTTFTNFTRGQKDNQEFNEQIEQARNGLDILARELRNLARPGATISGFGTTPSISRAESYDFIFQTSAPQRTWERYCLATSGTLAGQPLSQARGAIWEAISPTPTVTSSMTTGCPGTGWASTRLVADNVVNQVGGQDRPLFSFTCSVAGDCPSSNLLQVKGVRSDVFIDTNPDRRPLAQRVSTAVFLRNQNEPPTAEATYRPGIPGSASLNASGSVDPEGRTLRYFWFLGSMPSGWACGQAVPAGTAYLGGITATLSGPSGTTKPVYLVVCDPGQLGSQFGPMTVSFP